VEASTQKAVRKRGLAKVRIQTFTDLVFVWSSQAASDYKKRFRNRFSTSPTFDRICLKCAASPCLTFFYIMVQYSSRKVDETTLLCHSAMTTVLFLFCTSRPCRFSLLCTNWARHDSQRTPLHQLTQAFACTLSCKLPNFAVPIFWWVQYKRVWASITVTEHLIICQDDNSWISLWQTPRTIGNEYLAKYYDIHAKLCDIALLPLSERI
jgi:hypothetical protein